ncbi:hypothetical protein [Janthinobacterium sp.]|uniref:hypothetical protein n=1 Tax=Janthinobacterium sp. TaxID=1871054 RepID=UPI00258A621D|nr:hypothetical protein [Janthinobacterium sp.]MCX7289569.1 hypothetical protein [Janthinobacterium sp.]
MPVVLFAGVPEKLVRQAKAAASLIDAAYLKNWEIRFFPGNDRFPQIGTAQVNALLEKAAEHGGAHIIGFHQTDGSGAIAAQIRTHFRFRWGDSSILRSVASEMPPFQAHLEGMLAEEDRWRDHVMPRERSSPLILPGNIFGPLQGHADIWDECQMFGRHDEHFEQLAKKIRHFAAEHTKTYKTTRFTYMVDRANLVWKDSGPFHAKTPFPRRWKYSLEIEDKFHYDVEHQKKSPFAFMDSSGTSTAIKSGKHINIDCHGFKSH